MRAPDTGVPLAWVLAEEVSGPQPVPGPNAPMCQQLQGPQSPHPACRFCARGWAWGRSQEGRGLHPLLCMLGP